jgi:hypothetical protein
MKGMRSKFSILSGLILVAFAFFGTISVFAQQPPPPPPPPNPGGSTSSGDFCDPPGGTRQCASSSQGGCMIQTCSSTNSWGACVQDSTGQGCGLQAPPPPAGPPGGTTSNDPPSTPGQATSNQPPGSSQGQTTQQGTSGGAFENPIQSNTLLELVETIANIVKNIGIPLVAIFIIYAGFLFVTSQGDPKKLETAKTTLTYAVIGGIVIIGAYAIAHAIVDFARKL